jgi:serine/threonine-protein kinase
VRKLGEGGFGEVWMLQSRRDADDIVAAKVLKRDLSDADRNILEEEVRNLVRATALQCHPNVVCYRGHALRSVERGQPKQDVVLFDFVPGVEMFDYINKNLSGRPPPVQQAETVFDGLVAGLHFLHQRNVAHRDIKAENVMLRLDKGQRIERPILIDLGLSCFIDVKCRGRVGTKVYWPPEILYRRNDGSERPLTLSDWKKADVYMLGVLMYEYLTGKPLRTEFATQVADNEIDLSNFYPQAPTLQALVARMVDSDPRRRPSAQQLATDEGISEPTWWQRLIQWFSY